MFVREMRCCSVVTVIVDVGDDADDGGVDQAVDVEVAGHTKKAATKRRQKSVKKDSRGKKAATETKEKEAVLLAAHTAEEMDEIEDRVPASALGDNDGGVAAKEMETETEAALPTLASSEASGEVAETVTEAADMPGPALATEPRKTRGKGPKKAAEVSPKKRGRKAAAVAALDKEEEETEKKPGAKRGRKAVASVEEKREEEAPELAVPEPEVSSSTR